MTELITRAYDFIYARPFQTILLWMFLALVIWTVANLVAPKHARQWINTIAAVVSVVVILSFTVIDRSTHAVSAVKLQPFWSIRNGLYREVWLNVFLFFPYGLSIPYILHNTVKHKAAIAILSATVFSFLIELTQFIFKLGLCETDDLIMNTLGAAIGTLSFIIADRIRTKRNRGKA